jgi:[ribosomal protein S5]-alanine N-acetyltransferase
MVLSPSPFRLCCGSVELRPFGQTELQSADYLAWLNDPRVTRTLGRPEYLFPVTRADVEAYIAAIDPRQTLFMGIYWTPPEGEEQRFVGTFKIYDFDPIARRAALGVMVGDPACWGRGIATQAIAVACTYMFETIGYRKLTAGYLDGNVGMERAFLKNGFRIEAVFKDHLLVGGHYVDHKYVCRFQERELCR